MGSTSQVWWLCGLWYKVLLWASGESQKNGDGLRERVRVDSKEELRGPCM